MNAVEIGSAFKSIRGLMGFIARFLPHALDHKLFTLVHIGGITPINRMPTETVVVAPHQGVPGHCPGRKYLRPGCQKWFRLSGSPALALCSSVAEYCAPV